MLMNAIAQGGCKNIARESALKVDFGTNKQKQNNNNNKNKKTTTTKSLHRGVELASVLRLDFQSEICCLLPRTFCDSHTI